MSSDFRSQMLTKQTSPSNVTWKQPVERGRRPSNTDQSSQGKKTGHGSLESEYDYRDKNSFNRYRVFQVYWHEMAGDSRRSGKASDNGQRAATSKGSFTLDHKHGEQIFSKIRRMIVVGRLSRHCICVPIQTYAGKGTSKQGVEPEHHAMVYTEDSPPTPLEDEIRSGASLKMLSPIKIEPHVKGDILDPNSRINFSELYTVHCNVKMKPYGRVADKFHEPFDRLCHQVVGQILPRLQPRKPATAPVRLEPRAEALGSLSLEPSTAKGKGRQVEQGLSLIGHDQAKAGVEIEQREDIETPQSGT